jgi:WD40 repeat protein
VLKSAMLSTFVEDEVSSVDFSSDGSFIVSNFSRDGRAHSIHSGTWDNIVEMGEMGGSTPASPPRKSPIGYRNSVSSVAFSSDGRLIVIGSGDNTLKLRDAKSGALMKTFEGHHDSVSSVAFSSDGRFIVSGSMDHTLKLWDASTGGLLATYFVVDGHGVAYTPDDRFVTDGDPHAAFAIVRGSEQLSMDDFIAANRRDSLAGEIARSQAGKAP